MEFKLLELITAFGVSVFIGFGLGLAYEPFRILHKLGFSGSVHYFICDFIFMILFAFVTFFLCLVMLEGSVRFFVIIGEGIGFTLFTVSIRRLLDKIYTPIIIFFKKYVSKLLKTTYILMYNIKKVLIKLFSVLKNKVSKYVRKKKERKSNASKRLRKNKRNKT